MKHLRLTPILHLIIYMSLLWHLPAAATVDSTLSEADSLRQVLQEARMHELALQQMLDESGRSAREDSLRKALQQQRIDSLRSTTSGVALVVDGDTLLRFYASLGGETPSMRAETVARRINRAGKSLSLATDSVHVFESELTSDVMYGEHVIMRISDLDALWNGTTRSQLAPMQAEIIRLKIEAMQANYGLKAKLWGVAWAVLLIVVQVLLFFLTSRLTRFLRTKVLKAYKSGRLRPLVLNGYQLVSASQATRFMLFLTRVVQVFLIVTQLLVSLPLLFSIFPETERFTWQMVHFVWDPFEDILLAFIDYLPSLVKIAVILYIVRWVLKGVKHFSDDIATGRLRIERFYADWAQPTYQIIRIFIVAFTLVVIWPLLPGSDSGVFKGVSIFVAALFSLGSTASIGNLVSGIIITYMRPFQIGDFVKIGDKEGVVIEKNTFITRLRDIKNNIVTVPNNSILSMETVNYTTPTTEGRGTIVHSDFTFTYHVPRATVESYLLEAASRCTLLQQEPAPFVLYTALDDFYTHYEINAYTQHSRQLPDVYSELHRHIVDVFAEHGLDPTSNHFVAVTQQK